MSKHIISDELERPVRSMADGKVYTSKSQLRRSYRASGNPQGIDYTEVGNDPARLRDRPEYQGDRRGVRDAIERARFEHGMGRRPREERDR